jgi:hypothetical protein
MTDVADVLSFLEKPGGLVVHLGGRAGDDGGQNGGDRPLSVRR